MPVGVDLDTELACPPPPVRLPVVFVSACFLPPRSPKKHVLMSLCVFEGPALRPNPLGVVGCLTPPHPQPRGLPCQTWGVSPWGVRSYNVRQSALAVGFKRDNRKW